MKLKHIKLSILIAVFFIPLFINTGVQARSTSIITVDTVGNRVAPSRFVARSEARGRFGRNIRVIANRKIRNSNCRRVIIITNRGERESLKVCGK